MGKERVEIWAKTWRYKVSRRKRGIPGKSMKTRIETEISQEEADLMEKHSGEIHENKD